VEQSQDDGQDNVISLEVTVPAVSGGGSSKLIFEDKNAKTPDAVVVKGDARASIWFEQLTTGNSQSMAEIAVRENITDNYVSNLIHLAWLSPDIVAGSWWVIRRRPPWRGPRCSPANPMLCGDRAGKAGTSDISIRANSDFSIWRLHAGFADPMLWNVPPNLCVA